VGAELSLPVLPTSEMKKNDIEDADFVIIGISVYIGKLQVSK